MARKILVVDDSVTVRVQLRAILEGGGFDVDEAADGEHGLEQAKQGQPDLVISDLNMPKMDGLEMLKALREVDALKSTPVFMLTTEASSKAMQQGRQHGATAWMVKPVKPVLLLKGIDKVLSKA